MDFQTILATASPYVAYLLGFIGRVLIPYYLEKAVQPEPIEFDWMYVRGQLAGAVVTLIPTLLGGELLAEIGAMGWAAAFALAYFASDIGRGVQKLRSAANDNE